MQQPIHLILRTLAMADLCSAIIEGFVSITTTAAGYFYLGKTGCNIQGFLIGTFGKITYFNVIIVIV